MPRQYHPHIHHFTAHHPLPAFDGEALMGGVVILSLLATIAALVAGCWLPGF